MEFWMVIQSGRVLFTGSLLDADIYLRWIEDMSGGRTTAYLRPQYCGGRYAVPAPQVQS